MATESFSGLRGGYQRVVCHAHASSCADGQRCACVSQALWDAFGREAPPTLQLAAMQLAGRAVLLFLNHAALAKQRCGSPERPIFPVPRTPPR